MSPMSRASLVVLFIILATVGLGLLLLFFFKEETGPSKEGGPVEGIVKEEGKRQVVDRGRYHAAEAYYPPLVPIEDTEGAASATASLEAFVLQETSRFKDSFVSTLTAEDIQVQGLGGERIYTLLMDYDEYESASTVSYVYHMYADTPGAHPNVYYRTFVFQKETGKELRLDDLFVTDAYLQVLSEMSRAKIRATIGESVSDDMLLAGTTPDADNFQNFYLSGDELVIIFPPYQVGPWAAGTQEARLSLLELSALLAPEYR